MAEPARTYAADAWTDFWAGQGPGSRCMARAPELTEPLDAHWHRFAALLSRMTRVIDLGCGGGAAGRALRATAPQLHVTGIDYARIAPSDERGLELRPGVSMECLPFSDRTFGAAVSQFGYEYGNVGTAAKEVARVLMPGSPFSFLVHHPEGPLVAEMRRHRRAIEGLCGLRIQAAFFAGNANALAERFADLRQESSNDPIVEYAERGLRARIGDDRVQRLQVWQAVTEALAPELFMLDSLDFCCAEDRDVHDHVEPLTQWFDVRLPTLLRTGRGDPIAWEIHGTRLP